MLVTFSGGDVEDPVKLGSIQGVHPSHAPVEPRLIIGSQTAGVLRHAQLLEPGALRTCEQQLNYVRCMVGHMLGGVQEGRTERKHAYVVVYMCDKDLHRDR